jgi:hypothetical protein
MGDHGLLIAATGAAPPAFQKKATRRKRLGNAAKTLFGSLWFSSAGKPPFTRRSVNSTGLWVIKRKDGVYRKSVLFSLTG